MRFISPLLLAIASAFLLTHTTSCGDVVMEGIHDEVFEDSVKQYEMAVRSGNATQAQVYAGLAAACALQAGKEAEYRKYLRLEEEHKNEALLELKRELNF